jgi:hypothetical protein
VYEAVAARLQRRPARDLYHAALQVTLQRSTYVIEQAPVHDWSGRDRGVVAEGASAVGGQADCGSFATRSGFGAAEILRTLPKP